MYVARLLSLSIGTGIISIVYVCVYIIPRGWYALVPLIVRSLHGVTLRATEMNPRAAHTVLRYTACYTHEVYRNTELASRIISNPPVYTYHHSRIRACIHYSPHTDLHTTV